MPRNRPTRHLLAATALGVTLLLVGCTQEPPADDGAGIDGSEDAAADTHTVPTYYGDVEVPVEPERIVAVSYDTPWQLMSLGVTPVGAQDYSSFAASLSPERQDFIAQTEPVGNYGEIDYEAVLALDPDLIVGDAYEIDEAVYERLTELAPTAIVFGEERGDWKSIVDALALAVGADAELAEVSGSYGARLAELQGGYEDVLADYTFAPITFGNQEAEFSVMYPSGVAGSIYDELGVTYAPGIPEGDFPAGYESYPYERILEILGDADVIVTPAQADGATYEALQTLFDNDLFQALPAAAAGHVYQFPLGVTDYVTATAYLDRIEENVLVDLAQ